MPGLLFLYFLRFFGGVRRFLAVFGKGRGILGKKNQPLRFLQRLVLELLAGIEPATSSLPRTCSTD